MSLFASNVEFLAYDNRGLGKSGEFRGPYDIEACAGDALSILDAPAGSRPACSGSASDGTP